jgi:hypothetical protein
MKNKAFQLMIYLIIIKSAEIRTADPKCGLDNEQTKLSIANTKYLTKELGKENDLPDWIRAFNLISL